MAKDGASDANEQDETEIHDPAKAHADDEFDSLDEEAAD